MGSKPYSIRRAFQNKYWPAHQFIDAKGQIRFHHFGEGEYERSEQLIEQLLDEARRDARLDDHNERSRSPSPAAPRGDRNLGKARRTRHCMEGRPVLAAARCSKTSVTESPMLCARLFASVAPPA